MDDAQDPAFEAALYALLGRLLADEMDGELLEILRSPGVGEVFEDITAGCLDDIVLDAASAEYRRLFVSPDGVPAVAGAWLQDAEGAAAIVAQVERVGSELGLGMPEGVPLDHAGLLLPLLGWLVEHKGDAADHFVDTALSPWLPDFAKALVEGAEMPVYQVVGELLAVCAKGWDPA